jgi:hypothetical protein
MRQAISIAGLELLAIVKDSHAVSVAYAVQHNSKIEDDVVRNVALVDIGASSARVTISAMSRNTMRVLTTKSDRSVSGRAVDALLADFACSSIKRSSCSTTAIGIVRLLRAAERAKIVLSVNKDVVMRVPVVASDANGAAAADSDVDFAVTRGKLDELLAPMAQRLAALARSALGESGAASVALVEIVGGTSRVPALQTALQQAFGVSELSHHLSSDEAVLFGATYVAASVAPYQLTVIASLLDGAALDTEASNGTTSTTTKIGDDDAAATLAAAAMSDAMINASRSVLAEWRERDAVLAHSLESKNALEAFVYSSKDLLRAVARETASASDTDTADDADSGDDEEQIGERNLFVRDVQAARALRRALDDTVAWLDANGADASVVGARAYVDRQSALEQERGTRSSLCLVLRLILEFCVACLFFSKSIGKVH